MKPCRCRAKDPTHGKPYAIAHDIARRLNALGQRQVRCPDCRLYTVWTDRKTT